MKNLIFIITFALITFLLTKPIRTEDDKNKQTDEASKTVEEIDLNEVMAECNKSFTIQMSYVDALNKSGSFPDETDKTPKCYVRCMLINTGIMSNGGVLDPKRVPVIFASKHDGEVLVQDEVIASLCAERKEKCQCEKAYNFVKCFRTTEINYYEKETK
uniref:Odorant Binding Protein 14 n=1 Tax=Dendrolimus punctatus TaxID=238572 RepID=A0A2K8GKM3_9NEOP|nr:Odorant Binding Protein 14 [Dendrolimus punctatus]